MTGGRPKGAESTVQEGIWSSGRSRRRSLDAIQSKRKQYLLTKTSYGLAAICMVPSWGPETPLATRQLANGSAGVHCCHCCHCCDSCSPRLWVCNASNHDASLPAAPQPWHFICPTFNGPRRPINTLRVGGTASTQKTGVLFASPTTSLLSLGLPFKGTPLRERKYSQLLGPMGYWPSLATTEGSPQVLL
jgi:hypothetical protein